MSEPALLEVAEIRKHFGGTLALRGVSCRVEAGEVLALLGHNGAGKSTLIKILAGVYRADGGEVRIGGAPLAGGVAAAREAGLAVIYQDLSLFPNLSVAENIAGDLAGRFGYSSAAARKHAATALRRLGMEDAARHWLGLPLGELPIAVQQQVAIARALARQARILVLDEPTASLSVEETERLLHLVRQLAAQGCGIIFVSHRMAEVRSIADRFLVLRDGAVTLDRRADACNDAELAQALFGEHAEQAKTRTENVPATAGPVLLDVKDCSRAGEFEDVSLQLRAGEVCVLTGLVGSGRSEFAQSLFGLRRLDRGQVSIAGKSVSAAHPRAALRAGLAYVPEDRLKEGLFPRFSVGANLASATLDRLSRWGLLPQSSVSATRQIQEYGIRCAGARAPLTSLSGGNQQKVLLAKWQSADPQVLLLDEPTAGVDVGAKAEIHQRVRAWAGGGKAVLAISSDVDEVLDLADRVLVFHHGRLVFDHPRRGLTREQLVETMLTGADRHEGAQA